MSDGSVKFARGLVRLPVNMETMKGGHLMAFYLITIEQAWITAKGRCECRRLSHGHDNERCNKQLVLQNKDCEGSGAWSAHHIDPKGGDILSNCEILCRDCKEKVDGAEIEQVGKSGTNYR